MPKATPRIYNPDPGIQQPDHPRGSEYLEYCKRRRFPKPFWEWLQDQEQPRSDLQKLMDDNQWCRNPNQSPVKANPRARSRYYLER